MAGPLGAQENALGANVQGLLDYARAQSPELAAMRLDADAAAQRLGSAGALADPVLRVELMNINNYGNDASPSLWPAKVGSTEYRLMQPLPGWGKRDLRRDVAAADAEQASARAGATWAELAARIKVTYAEYYRTVGNERLTREVPQDDGARINRVYRLLFGRSPNERELAIARQIVAAGDPAVPGAVRPVCWATIIVSRA